MGVEFFCTKHKAHHITMGFGAKNATGDPAVAQLFVLVKSLCSAVTKLNEPVDAIVSSYS